MCYWYMIWTLLGNWLVPAPRPVSAARHVPATVPGSFMHNVVRNITLRSRIIAFAKTLVGTPYRFGSTNPAVGFDCSGFITYVYNHFGIEVPRSSVDFTNYGLAIPLAYAHPGDLILFTGTNANKRTVGHIGIIVSNDVSGVSFIHASSGTEEAVVITCLEDYYMGRFVKVVRILN